ncbi:ATP-binding protein [Sutcliffiella rhizosphaerae]|uniref:histidine kinase n=1 Tax=Sutcliffiella rhizosphaerae TaxID=2880967 RepID=A0ABN8A6L1_9BACI|nr:ATP-binding protein [Sutcliffiella rhizosphaerae]CAG9619285.1 Sporulation kinase A [Sutcliffiella rhizosphaerae]
MKKKWQQYIPLIYLLFGVIWLTLSDYWIYVLKQNNYIELSEYINLLKGWFFLILTTILIHLTMKKHVAFKELEQKEQELSTLINNMPDFVCFKDGEGRWLKTNDYGLSLYELQNVDYKGKTDLELGEFSPFFKEAFQYCTETDRQTWEGREISRAEESFFLANGERKTFDVIKVPLFYPDGKRKALVTIGRDISSLKKAEQLLLMKEKLSVAGELSAGIAHEIRNPLTSIKGFMQLIDRSGKADKHHVDLVLSEIDRINEIVSELLVLSKPQNKELQSVEVSEIIEYVIKLVDNEARNNNITLNIQQQYEGITVKGDKNNLKQVLINLIKNAMEAMPSGGTIVINCQQISNRQVNLEVIDDGDGISETDITKIGDPFFTSKERGMGLGLTITKKIIQDHDGSLQINSKKGKGTTVSIILPTP